MARQKTIFYISLPLFLIFTMLEAVVIPYNQHTSTEQQRQMSRLSSPGSSILAIKEPSNVALTLLARVKTTRRKEEKKNNKLSLMMAQFI